MEEKLKLYDYQEEGVRMELEMKRCINGDDMGLGKLQPIDAIVKTPSGDKKIGHVKVGDLVFSRDGKPHVVTGVFPQGKKEIFRVVFSDGVATEAGLEHLWTVRDRNRSYRGRGWTVKTTKELLDRGLYEKENIYNLRNCKRTLPTKWEIPMCSPVEYETKEYFIHPYILGVLIGDGSLSDGAIFSNPDIDEDIHIKVRSLLHKGYILTEDRSSSCPRYRIVNIKRANANPYIAELKRLKLNVLSSEKYIPKEYLYGDIDQRKELLFGLMDTDGSVAKGNRISYSTTSFRLARDIATLVRSLGGQAIVRKYTRKDKKHKEEYRVNVRTSFNPFSCFRKHYSVNIKSKHWPVRKILTIVKVGLKDSVCIMVDEPEHTYLTDDFIVTHNTVQSIVAVERAKATPCLVICPSALKINWEREVKKFTNLRPLILTDSVNATFGYHISDLNLFDVVICNYESLQKYFVVDLGPKPLKLKNFIFRNEVKMLKSVIIDESARVKDPSTRQSKVIMGICSGKEYIYELTGTPIVNRATDIACQIAILGRINEFGGYGEFMNRYGTNNNLKELNEKIHELCYFRREKSEVLKQLPELTRTVVSVDIDNETRLEYETCQRDLLKFLLEYKDCTEAEARKKLRMKSLVQFMNLRSISGKGKMKAAIEFLHDTQEQIIVFAEHRDVVQAIKDEFPDDICTVTGSDSLQMKQWAVDSFQAGKKRIIVCSIKAAGVGLTLTASSNVLFIELPWTMADLAQCECRAHRNGQKNAVTSWIMLGNDTIDSYLYHLINQKGSIASQVTGEQDSAIRDTAYFDELANLVIENSLKNK